MSTGRRLGLVCALLLFVMGAEAAAPLLSFQEVKKVSGPPWDQVPFWSRPEMQERMRGPERSLVVSVTTDKIKEPVRAQLHMKGAGFVRRSRDETIRIATDFANIKEWSPYFQEARYEPARQQVAIRVGVLVFTANSLVQFQKDTCGEETCLLWEVLAGTFQGLHGGIRFVEKGPQQTEISIHAEHEATSLPFFAGLTTMALEGVLQRLAGSLRDYVEKKTLASH